MFFILVVALAAAGYYWYQGRDERYAKQVIDCMYAGSFEPIKDTLNSKSKETLDSPQIKNQLCQVGVQLKNEYGDVDKLEFKSEEPVTDAPQEYGGNVVKKTWTATSKKGTFDWMFYMDKDGKLIFATPGRLIPQ